MSDLIEIPLHTKSNTIELTESGAKAVQGLLEKRELSSEEYALRVFISGGGCSGFQYGMALEGEVRETDYDFSYHGVRLVVDEVSMDYLRGARIDYIEDIMGSGFKIDNPNAVASCGCGSSFRTKESQATDSGAGCGH
jgi:iron-sulfur cluster assembly accessory protein